MNRSLSQTAAVLESVSFEFCVGFFVSRAWQLKFDSDDFRLRQRFV